MKFFLRHDWEKEYKKVTKIEYIDAEGNVGFLSNSCDGIATMAFSGHGISGKIEHERGDENGYEEECY